MECADIPVAKPRTKGLLESHRNGVKHSNSVLPMEAPMQPVIRIEATESFGSHSGPIAMEPSIPSADITERLVIGRESGAGILSGDIGWLDTRTVPNAAAVAETPEVTKTQRRFPGSSYHLSVVLYMRKPRALTATASH